MHKLRSNFSIARNTCGKIPYRWRSSTEIRMVPLIGCYFRAKLQNRTSTNQSHWSLQLRKHFCVLNIRRLLREGNVCCVAQPLCLTRKNILDTVMLIKEIAPSSFSFQSDWVTWPYPSHLEYRHVGVWSRYWRTWRYENKKSRIYCQWHVNCALLCGPVCTQH